MSSYCIWRAISILLGLIPHPTYLTSLETLKRMCYFVIPMCHCCCLCFQSWEF
jgi:hypothetical protein